MTKQSGVAEVLYNTFKYDFWDVDRLADQIVGVATSEALQSSLKGNVAQEYAQVSWQDIAKRCTTLYRKVHQRAERALV
jgi:glycogen(starch) synthase